MTVNNELERTCNETDMAYSYDSILVFAGWTELDHQKSKSWPTYEQRPPKYKSELLILEPTGTVSVQSNKQGHMLRSLQPMLPNRKQTDEFTTLSDNLFF
jgi:hypothetical protein